MTPDLRLVCVHDIDDQISEILTPDVTEPAILAFQSPAFAGSDNIVAGIVREMERNQIAKFTGNAHIALDGKSELVPVVLNLDLDPLNGTLSFERIAQNGREETQESSQEASDHLIFMSSQIVSYELGQDASITLVLNQEVSFSG